MMGPLNNKHSVVMMLIVTLRFDSIELQFCNIHQFGSILKFHDILDDLPICGLLFGQRLNFEHS